MLFLGMIKKMILYIRVNPSASVNKVEEIDDTHFKISLTVSAKDGRANLAAIKLLAKHLGIAPSRIELVSGHTSRDKVFVVV